MPKYKVFISSVQSEFSKERQLVKELLAPEIDLSAEFITTIWRDNNATNIATNLGTNDATNSDANGLITNTNNATNIGTNIGTSGNNVALTFCRKTSESLIE